MGKMILILLAGAGFLFSIIQLNSSRSNNEMVQNAVSNLSNAQATNNASSGIDIAIKHLSDDTTWTGVNNINLAEGSVKITVSNTSSKFYQGASNTVTKARLVTSIGSYNNQTDTVRAVIQLPGVNALNIPKFLRYSVASGQNINLGGNIFIRDDNNTTWNANIHTNGNFFMNGNNNIHGFLTYGGTAGSSPSHRLNTNIVPNTNPDNLANHRKTPLLEIPDIIPSQYQSIVHQVYNSSVTFTGNQSLGTKDNPKLIYVNGDLTISGTFTGYGAIVVNGNINTNGNLEFTAMDPSSNNLGLYCSGNISLNGGTVKAQLMAGGSVHIGSNTTLYGGITAKGLVSFQGGADFYYRPINRALTDPFFPPEDDYEIRPKIVSYYH